MSEWKRIEPEVVSVIASDIATIKCACGREIDVGPYIPSACQCGREYVVPDPDIIVEMREPDGNSPEIPDSSEATHE